MGLGGAQEPAPSAGSLVEMTLPVRVTLWEPGTRTHHAVREVSEHLLYQEGSSWPRERNEFCGSSRADSLRHCTAPTGREGFWVLSPEELCFLSLQNMPWNSSTTNCMGCRGLWRSVNSLFPTPSILEYLVLPAVSLAQPVSSRGGGGTGGMITTTHNGPKPRDLISRLTQT